MVKSFHKKRKNFKNKTKRNKLRRTKKNKNKKMIGGEIGDTASYLGNYVLIGFTKINLMRPKPLPHPTDHITSSMINEYTLETPLFAPKNFENYDTNFILNDEKKYECVYDTDLYGSQCLCDDYRYWTLCKIFNPWSAWTIYNKRIRSYSKKRTSCNNFYYDKNFDDLTLILPNLNLLPKVKNINIYKLMLCNVEFLDENNKNISLSSIKDITYDLLSEYVDLKYYHIVENCDYKFENIYEDNSNKELRKNGKDMNFIIVTDYECQKIYGMTIKDKCKQLKNEIIESLDDEDRKSIEELERTYPSLIARVLLETDAELAGEEPRENRIRRASYILEEGMKKFPSVSSKEIPIPTNNKNIRPELLLSDDESIPSKEISSDVSIPSKEISSDVSIPSKEISSDMSIPSKEISSDESSNLKKIPKIPDHFSISSSNFKYELPFNHKQLLYEPDPIKKKETEKKFDQWYEETRIPSGSLSKKMFGYDIHQLPEIDMTPYKVIKMREGRYAALESEINNQDIFNIYELKEYISPRDFKIKNKNPVGTFDKKNKKVKIFLKT
jgi:hypothetical protein